MTVKKFAEKYGFYYKKEAFFNIGSIFSYGVNIIFQGGYTVAYVVFLDRVIRIFMLI